MSERLSIRRSAGFTLTEFADANGTKAVMDEAPRHFFQTPAQVVEATLAANARGKVVVVPGWHNKLAVKYGVESIPFAVLVGPDGKIIGKALRGEELEDAVAHALAQR